MFDFSPEGVSFSVPFQEIKFRFFLEMIDFMINKMKILCRLETGKY